MSSHDLSEQWLPVPGYESTHEVSSLGRVRLIGTVRGYGSGHLLTNWPNHLGYSRVKMRKDGKLKAVFVHKIVASAFLGPPAAGQEINHKNFDRSDNSAENLEYLTHEENVRASAGRGRFRKRLNPCCIREIRSKFQSGASQDSIASEFGISQQSISEIVRGCTWSHLE